MNRAKIEVDSVLAIALEIPTERGVRIVHFEADGFKTVDAIVTHGHIPPIPAGHFGVSLVTFLEEAAPGTLAPSGEVITGSTMHTRVFTTTPPGDSDLEIEAYVAAMLDSPSQTHREAFFRQVMDVIKSETVAGSC